MPSYGRSLLGGDWARAEVRGNACVSAGKAAEGVPGATTKKVVLVCPYASCLGFSGRSQRKPTLGDAGSVQASRGDVRSARSGEGGQGRMHGEAVTCHLYVHIVGTLFLCAPNL